MHDEAAGSGDIPEPDWLDGPYRAPRRSGPLPALFAGARLALSRRAVAALALVGLAAVVLAGYAVWRERPVVSQVAPVPAVRMAAADTSREPEPDAAAPAELVVSVVGMVRRGGLVRLPQGARVADALEAAGGAVPGADLHGLNLAQRVADGDQILVGAADPAAPPRGSSTAGSGGAAPGVPGSRPAPNGTAKVNLNTATEAELDALPGVGPVTARAIVAWRTGNGAFSDVEQLGDVEGIGPARLAKLRDQVTI